VEGCIAPGLGVAMAGSRFMVTDSRAAMNVIRDFLGRGQHTLEIRAFKGAHLYE